MSAIDHLDGSLILPMRDEDCSACRLFSHGIHCQRTTRRGTPCACPCHPRVQQFDALTVASRSPVSAPAPQGPPVAGERNGTVSLLPSAAARPTVPTSNESRVPHRGLPDAKAEGRKRGLVVASGRKSLSCADQERRLDTSPPGSRSTAPTSGDAA